MASRLPDKLTPQRMARSGATLRGVLPAAQLPRLQSACEDTITNADVYLEFSLSDFGIPLIQGQLSSTAQLTCQRCLEPVAVSLVANVAVLVVGNNEERELVANTAFDGVDAGERDSLPLAPFVEDELLLQLPDYPAHPDAGDGACEVAEDYDAAAVIDERPSPFAGLRELLKPEQ